MLLKDGLWRYSPLPSQEEVNSWYADKMVSDDESVAVNRGLWQTFFDENLRWLSSKYLVDIGAGRGFFVDYANSKQRHCIGIEPNPSVHGHLHLMGYDKFMEIPHPAGAMGRMRLVLEHVLEPVEFLKFWRQYLDKLLIIVPNEFNPLQIELTELYNYTPVGLPHLSYFTPASLERVCRDAGWIVTRQSATFPMELWPRLGFNYVLNPTLGDKCHLMRLKFEKSFGPLAFRLYQYWYNTYGWGRELVFLVE